MKYSLLVLILVIPYVVSAQEVVPEIRVVANADTARGWWVHEDTLNVQIDLGDTVSVEFFSHEWPTVSGYWIRWDHRSNFLFPEQPHANDLFEAIGYQTSDFLEGPDLPTSQSGIVHIDGNKFQVGLVSLGERQDSGSKFLGALTFTLIKVFEDTVRMEIERFGLQPPPDSTVIGGNEGIGISIIMRVTNLPPPQKPITSDFNENGAVDFQDFIAFASVFGTIQGKDENYDPNLDIVLDGFIDFQDFLLFVSHFGKPPVPIR